MHGTCPGCGAEFDASTPPALVALILEHPCDGNAGRCGAPSPAGRLFCGLNAGHAGMHAAQDYPAGVLSYGVRTDWT